MFTIPIYYNKRGKRKIPPHVLAFYSLSYLLLRERPDESPAVPVFCAHGAQAGIEWFVPVGARSARPGFALKGGGESARASRAGMRPARPPRGQEGALPPLAGHPRRGRFTGARDRKQILSTFCGKI